MSGLAFMVDGKTWARAILAKIHCKISERAGGLWPGGRMGVPGRLGGPRGPRGGAEEGGAGLGEATCS